jgi:Ca2+-binding EF-hand superfamily protein
MGDVLRAFDQRQDKTIDVGDVGLVFRAMGIQIGESDLNDLVSELVKEPGGKTVHIENLAPRLLAAVDEKRWRPTDGATLELAFLSLEALENPDLFHPEQQQGLIQQPLLTRERLEHYMQNMGEPLSGHEMRDMLAHMAVGKSGVVEWRAYVRELLESWGGDGGAMAGKD